MVVNPSQECKKVRMSRHLAMESILHPQLDYLGTLVRPNLSIMGVPDPIRELESMNARDGSAFTDLYDNYAQLRIDPYDIQLLTRSGFVSCSEVSP